MGSLSRSHSKVSLAVGPWCDRSAYNMAVLDAVAIVLFVLAALVFGSAGLLLWLAHKEDMLNNGASFERLSEALKSDPADDPAELAEDLEQQPPLKPSTLLVSIEAIHRQVCALIGGVGDVDAKMKVPNSLRIRWHPDKNTLLHDFAVKTSQVINEEKQKLQTKQKLAAARKKQKEARV